MVQPDDTTLADGGPQSSGFNIKASIAARLNVAFHQNSVPAIAEIELVNGSEQDWPDITVSVTSVPEFLQPKDFRLDRLKVGATQRLNPVSVDLNPKFLLGVTEAIRGEITLTVRQATGNSHSSRRHAKFCRPTNGPVCRPRRNLLRLLSDRTILLSTRSFATPQRSYGGLAEARLSMGISRAPRHARGS